MRRFLTPSLFLFAVILLFFFVSGACGLLYQVVWTRKLVLIFGTTAYAVSTVLSIFFLGLGLGSFWGGRLADRSRRPLWLYGVFEIVIGLWAAVFLLLVEGGEGVAVSLLHAVEGSYALGIALRALMTTILLIVPVTLMGATLPLLARYVHRQGPVRGYRIGALYTINTFGAVAGCAVAGFVFLEAFGYTRTTFIGAAANVLVGLLAVVLSRKTERGTQEAESKERTDVRVEGGALESVATRRLVILAFGVSGFASLGLEVVWTRLLAIVFYGTTYAFTTMLTTVLCGIALGSAVASILADRIKHPVTVFGLVQVLTGIACLLTLSLYPDLPDRLVDLQRDAGFEWGGVVYATFWLCFIALLAPTFLFGMSFPLAVRAVVPNGLTLGRDVGRLYSVNTMGGVLGSAVGGFVLLPLLGAHWSVLGLSLVLCAMGAELAFTCPTQPRGRRRVYAAASVAATVAVFFFLPSDVSRSLNQWFLPEDHEMISYAEGVEGTVVVSAPIHDSGETDRVLWINAVQATASIEKGVKMNRFQGVLPLLFNRDPENALFMCFGSGVTAGTLGVGPLKSIDAVEISHDVLAAAPLFGADNFNVIENPKLNFIVNDGRNYLLTTDKTYDFLTFEPMPLALAGVSTFYTRDYYELCRARLNPGGMVSQWVPLHSLNDAVVRSMIATFLDVFPEACAWFINSDVFIVGSDEPLAIDYTAAQRKLEAHPALTQGLEDVFLKDLTEILACFMMDRARLVAYAGDAPIMTDDRPWAEFVAPKLIYEGNVPDMLAAIKPFRQSPTALLDESSLPANAAVVKNALDRRYQAHMADMDGLMRYYGGGPSDRPEDDFRRALEIDPNDYNAQYYLAEILFARGELHTRWEELDQAVAMLEEAAQYAPHRADIHLALGHALRDRGDLGRAVDAYKRYLALGGTDPDALEHAGE